MKWQEYNSRVLGALTMKDNMHKEVVEAGLRDFSEFQLEHLHAMINKAFKKFESETLTEIEDNSNVTW